MRYCYDEDWQLEIAKRLVRKDHKQRWVYFCRKLGAYRISESPMPYVDKISVSWCAIPACVTYNYSPRLLAQSFA